MNIPAVKGNLSELLATREPPQARPADSQPGVAKGSAAPGMAAVPSAATTSPRASSSLPVHAPPGTDPDLWSILTAEERTFFARKVTTGPLTYLKMMLPNSTPMAPAGVRGRRLDVRG